MKSMLKNAQNKIKLLFFEEMSYLCRQDVGCKG